MINKNKGKIISIYITINLMWLFLFGVNNELYSKSHFRMLSNNEECLFDVHEPIKILNTVQGDISVLYLGQSKIVSYMTTRNECGIEQYGIDNLASVNCFVYLTYLILNLEQLSERYKKTIEYIHETDGCKNKFHLFLYK